MELFVYSGLESLASIDFDCLRTLVTIQLQRKVIHSVILHKLLSILQAYVKFHEIPVKICFSGSPSKSPTGFLPYLQTEDNDTLLGGYDEIIAHFQSKVYFEFPQPIILNVSSAFIISGLQRR